MRCRELCGTQMPNRPTNLLSASLRISIFDSLLPRLANACNAPEKKLVVWTLLVTGLRVSKFANLRRANLDWQTHRLMIHGKGRRRRVEIIGFTFKSMAGFLSGIAVPPFSM